MATTPEMTAPVRYRKGTAVVDLPPQIDSTAEHNASLLTPQESYFRRLLDGMSPQDAGRALAEDVEFAFDLLEHGLSHAGGQ